jgi:hypothetical protein
MNEFAMPSTKIHLGTNAAQLALDRITTLLVECAYGIENGVAKQEIIGLILALRQCGPTPLDLDRKLCNLEASVVLLYSFHGHQKFAGGAEGLKHELISSCATVRQALKAQGNRSTR